MRTVRLVATTLLIGSMTLAASLPATSAPLMNAAAKAAPASDITNVQYYYGQRGYGYRGGYGGGYGYRGGYGYGGHRHNDGAGLAIGLAAGAIIGGAIAASQAQANKNAAYCAQRYRSYDPRSGTYLNVDGNRYPCP